MKFLVCTLLIFGAVSAAPKKDHHTQDPPTSPELCSSENEHNLVWGANCETLPNKLLYTGNIKAQGASGETQFRQVTYPDLSETIKNIACIKVLNKLTPIDKAGCIAINAGGIGLPYVTVDFFTQKSEGMFFVYYIYGEKNE